MTEPTNGLAPKNEAGKFDELVAATIRMAVDEWRVHNDPADVHGVSMPEYVRQALADAGLLASATPEAEPAVHEQSLSELRSRIETAIQDRAPVWGQKFDAGPGLVCSVSDAATVATRVVATEVSQLRADMKIRQGALNDVLGRDRSQNSPTDYYDAIEDVAELKRELAAWRSGARRHAWPVVQEVPDGITYAAHLAHAQGTEGGEEHDQLLREAAQRMKALHDVAQVLLQERTVLTWLHAEAVWHAEHHRAQAETQGLSHALLLNGYRGFVDQVRAMAKRIGELDAELAEFRFHPPVYPADLFERADGQFVCVCGDLVAERQAHLDGGYRWGCIGRDCSARSELERELDEFRAEAEARAEAIDDYPHGDCTDPPGLQCSDAGCPEHGDRDDVDEDELEDEVVDWPADVIEGAVASPREEGDGRA